MPERIKILFVIPTLTAGGAERIMTFLARKLNLTLFDTTLIVTGSPNNAAYEIEDMKIQFLNHSRVLFSIPSLVSTFRREKPDIVMGSISHMNLAIGLISLFFRKITFVGRQSGITKSSSSFNDNRKNILFDFLLKLGLRQLDFIVCQSMDMLNDCKEVFHIKSNKLKIIHNPITDGFELQRRIDPSKSENKVFNFITVGRMYKIKGHERILKILSKLELPFIYTIIGDGPEKSTLVALVDALKLKSKVKFVPFTREVSNYLAQSDFFLQGSYSEGFPNALLESCAVGTPVIAFNVPGGTREIIEEEVNGYLVSNEEDFLYRLQHLGHFQAQEVSKSVQNKFAMEIIIKRYQEFFQELVAR